MEKEVVELWKAKGRLGQSILKEDYDAISEFILSILSKKESVALQDLLNEAQISLFPLIKKDFNRHLLEVKQDMEAKGMIVVTRQANRVQYISATRKSSWRERAGVWGSRR